MLNNKKVYAVIPARGGSKGIPRKNLYRLGKDTLLERAIKLGKACKYVDYVIVSTDDPEMFEIAKRYNVNTHALRPVNLATDTAKTVDVILHVIKELNIQDSYILLLQTTSPLRTLDDLENMFKIFEAYNEKADAIVSLTEYDDPHPNKIQKIESGYVVPYISGEFLVPRQSLPKVYKLNGAFYLTHSDIITQQNTLLPERTIPFLMPKEKSINLDSMMDLYLLEALIEKGIVILD